MIYKNDLSKQKSAEKSFVIRYICSWIPAVALSGLFIYFLTGGKVVSLYFLAGVMAFVVFEGIVVIWFTLKRNRALYPNYELEITDEYIECRNICFLRRIQKSEIKAINLVAGKKLEIIGSFGEKIFVASTLEKFDELKETLNSIRPVTVKFSGQFIPLALLVSGVLYAASLYFRNVPFFFVSAPLFVILLSASFIRMMNQFSYRPIVKILFAVVYLKIIYNLVSGIATVVKTLWF